MSLYAMTFVVDILRIAADMGTARVMVINSGTGGKSTHSFILVIIL